MILLKKIILEVRDSGPNLVDVILTGKPILKVKESKTIK